MDIREITPDYFVAPQIEPADMAAIAAAGIRAVICNRPDAEVPPSHHADVLKAAAEQAGLDFHILPLTHQTMTPDVIVQHMALASRATPVLAYCASGTRCSVAWALGRAAQGMEPEDILKTTRAAGYALDAMRPTLEAAFRAS